MMALEIISALAVFVLAIGSYTDFKKREVPDWLSHALIFSAICLRGIFSVYLQDYSLITTGLLGLGIMYLLAALMYYTGQWGGGDAKLLMGLGAVMGLEPLLEIQPLIMFLINLVIVGALYGTFWTFYLMIRHWSGCLHEFRSIFSNKKARYFRFFIYALFVIFFFASYGFGQFKYFLLVLAVTPLLLYYVWAYTKVVENVAMLKKVLPSELTEGDWIAEDIMVGGKRICGPKDLGISKHQISELIELHKHGRIKQILIKEGIPFVPSFFISYIVTLVFGNWIILFI
jgi:Flp pilus assembly protein protease CpaA